MQNVLIVDDDLKLLKMLQRTLVYENLSVFTATNGLEALPLVQSQQPDLTARREGSRVEIRVQDFGEGIPPETLKHVFDRFYRGDDRATIPGFGLGLSIAKSLLDGMNGKISIKSAPEEGTTVVLELPSLA